jgi:hypothetical protein
VDHDVAIHIAGRSNRSVEMNVSFEVLYRTELHGQVQRAALLLGSATSANDVVHDAFIAVFQRWDSLDAPGPYELLRLMGVVSSSVDGLRDFG